MNQSSSIGKIVVNKWFGKRDKILFSTFNSDYKKLRTRENYRWVINTLSMNLSANGGHCQVHLVSPFNRGRHSDCTVPFSVAGYFTQCLFLIDNEIIHWCFPQMVLNAEYYSRCKSMLINPQWSTPSKSKRTIGVLVDYIMDWTRNCALVAGLDSELLISVISCYVTKRKRKNASN